MASGLPKSFIKKYGISKRAWKEFRKSKGRTTSRTRTTPRRRGVRRLTRRKKRRRAKRTIAILPIAGLAAGIIEPIRRGMAGDFEGAVIELVQTTTGVNLDDSTWHPEWMGKFWYPVIAGAIGHKVAGMLGVNRMFAKLPSPLNKLRL